nr:hypothetical protein CFP56_09257 [Quercus suber]
MLLVDAAAAAAAAVVVVVMIGYHVREGEQGGNRDYGELHIFMRKIGDEGKVVGQGKVFVLTNLPASAVFSNIQRA